VVFSCEVCNTFTAMSSRTLLSFHVFSSRSYEPPNKLFVIPGDMGMQQIIHGLEGGRVLGTK